MSDGQHCGRELYDNESCIFHSNNKNKDVELFQKNLDEIFKDESLENYDLTHFIFPEGVVFPERFSKRVFFLGATFDGEADFFDTVFEDEANFSGADFQGEANFIHAVFNNWGNFFGAGFEGDATFIRAVFKGKANFGVAVFKNDANFEDATFWDEADFVQATFEGTLVLAQLKKDQQISFLPQLDFRRVKFSKPERVQFQKVDLSYVRFLETDLRKVHFTDVDWNKEKGKGRNRVFDEVSHDPFTKKFDYALIAQLYRRLRANYEENLRYSEAGDFYIGEMEMTRKAERSIFKKLPLLFYKAISNYGESYYRPLCWILAILLIFPLLFMFAGIQPISLDPNNPKADVIHYRLDFSSTGSFLPTTEKIGDYYTSFLYSMSVFSFIRDKKYTTIDNWGHTLFVIESILSPVTLAFFLLALRRRFKR